MSALTASSLASLVEAFPEAPKAELERFAAARPGKGKEAVKFYKSYVKWRSEEGSAEALVKAAAPAERDGRGVFATLGGFVGEERDRLLLVEGARLDLSVDPKSYVAALCRRMDEALSREDSSRVVVLIDTRSGRGWPNPPALKLVPFLRLCASSIPDRYPERLRKVVVYPLPSWAKTLISLVKRLLEPVTRDKIAVVKGDDSRDAPCPPGLAKHVKALDDVPEHARRRHAVLPSRPAPVVEPAATPVVAVADPQDDDDEAASGPPSPESPAPPEGGDAAAWEAAVGQVEAFEKVRASSLASEHDGAPVWVSPDDGEYLAATVVERKDDVATVRAVDDGALTTVPTAALLPREVR